MHVGQVEVDDGGKGEEEARTLWLKLHTGRLEVAMLRMLARMRGVSPHPRRCELQRRRRRGPPPTQVITDSIMSIGSAISSRRFDSLLLDLFDSSSIFGAETKVVVTLRYVLRYVT